MRSLAIACSIAGAIALSIPLAGCKKGEHRSAPGAASGSAASPREAPVRLSFPGTPEGARLVALELAKPGAYILSVFRALRPDPADYDAVFLPEVAAAVRAELDPLFDMGNVAMKVGPELSELKLDGVSVEDLRAGTGHADRCPGAYKKAAKHMRPGVVIYCFKMVKPGSDDGPARDGLTYVNGHWAIFPKPFSAIRGALKDAGVVEDDD
ncbi:MAG: hypothetical protein U0359_26570 [Byssovorax sp.]